MDEQHNCWMCLHCVYDLEKGNYCRRLQKPLGGNCDICRPNDCDKLTTNNTKKKNNK